VCRRRERRGRRGVEDGGLCTLIKTLVKDSKGKGRGCRGGNLLLGVQCGESQGIWGCSAVKNNNSFFNHGQRRN